MADRAWLVDASIYIFRAWFSLPERWHSPEGVPLHAVYGYTKFLLDLVEHTGTAAAGAAAFDESLGSNFRNAIYPDYKCSRELPDEVLAFQLQACRDVTELLGVPCYSGPRFEADDYIASLARLFREAQIPVTVITRDKDLGQLILGADDQWWDPAQDQTLDARLFEEKFGVKPEQFADYLALVGDPIDDIPGAPGVGAKTAATLLQTFGNLEVLQAEMDSIASLSIRGAAKLAARLREHWDQVGISRQLTGLHDRIPGIATRPNFALTGNSLHATAEYLSALNLAGPLTRRCSRLAGELRTP